MIEEYKFGLIVINGKTYTQDVEVRWNGEVLKWQRLEGHVFNVEDVKRAIDQSPDKIILGIGAYGVCKVTEDCQNFIKGKGVKLIIEKTEEAVKIFNRALKEPKENKVIGLFHLTC